MWGLASLSIEDRQPFVTRITYQKNRSEFNTAAHKSRPIHWQKICHKYVGQSLHLINTAWSREVWGSYVWSKYYGFLNHNTLPFAFEWFHKTRQKHFFRRDRCEEKPILETFGFFCVLASNGRAFVSGPVQWLPYLFLCTKLSMSNQRCNYCFPENTSAYVGSNFFWISTLFWHQQNGST